MIIRDYHVIIRDYHVIIRDYHMGVWLSLTVSTRDSIISPRALARGLILVEGLY